MRKICSTLALGILLAAGLAAGCAAYKGMKAAANQPTDSFEEYSYRVLLDAQAGLNKTRAELQAGTLPASFIPIFDRAAIVYNKCLELETSYDKIVRSGGDPATVRGELTQDLASLVGLIAELRPAKSKVPARVPTQ